MNVRDLTKYGKLGDQIMALGGVRLRYVGGEVSNGDKLAKSFGPRRSEMQSHRDLSDSSVKPIDLPVAWTIGA